MLRNCFTFSAIFHLNQHTAVEKDSRHMAAVLKLFLLFSFLLFFFTCCQFRPKILMTVTHYRTSLLRLVTQQMLTMFFMQPNYDCYIHFHSTIFKPDYLSKGWVLCVPGVLFTICLDCLRSAKAASCDHGLTLSLCENCRQIAFVFTANQIHVSKTVILLTPCKSLQDS